MIIIKKFYKHILFFLISLIIVYVSVTAFFNKLQQSYLSVQTDLIINKYNTNYKYFEVMSNDIFQMYQENDQLISIFAKAKDSNTTQRNIIRQEMYELLYKRYRRLVNMGIHQLHFHLPDNTSFLRMHKVDKYGDKLTKIRKSVAYTNRSKQKTSGYEVGKVADGFRYVYPLFDKNKIHIGSVEVSYSRSKLLENVSDTSVISRHLIIQEKIIQSHKSEHITDYFYQKSLENDNYLILKSTLQDGYNNKIKQIFEDKALKAKITKDITLNEPFSLHAYYNFDSISITFIPIHSAVNNEKIAYLVIYTDADYLDMLLVEEYYTLLLINTILLLIFFFSIYFTFTQRKLEKMAHFDKLTNLPNRAYFLIELELELKRAKRHNEKFSLLFIDLDGFKTINDTYGHNVGDELLIAVSRRLEKVVRGVDIVSRLGGDEFVVLITEVHDNNDAILVAEKIIKKLSEDFFIHKNKMNIGASVGIATFPEHGEDSKSLIGHSDNAMYEAKKNGKNCYYIMNTNKGS